MSAGRHSLLNPASVPERTDPAACLDDVIDEADNDVPFSKAVSAFSMILSRLRGSRAGEVLLASIGMELTEGSIRQAAKTFGVSQEAVARQIQQVRPLFEGLKLGRTGTAPAVLPPAATGWLSKTQVASRLGVSLPTVAQYARLGLLAQHHGHHANGMPAQQVFFAESAIAALQERFTREGKNAVLRKAQRAARGRPRRHAA